MVTILGTRIFPAPNIYDIVMDIRAETQPFLGGEAHAGMVIGAKNLMSRSWEAVREACRRTPHSSPWQGEEFLKGS